MGLVFVGNSGGCASVCVCVSLCVCVFVWGFLKYGYLLFNRPNDKGLTSYSMCVYAVFGVSDGYQYVATFGQTCMLIVLPRLM